MSSKPDQVLIQEAQQGNKDALAVLYEKYVDQMTRYVSYRVGSMDVIRDIVGNVFLIMIEKLPHYQWTGAPFEAWLYKIAQAQVATFYRKNNNNGPPLEYNETLSTQSPDLNITQQEQFEEMRNAIQKLDEEDQQILILRFVENKTHQDVAQIMGKTSGAIMTAQHRALKRLAHYLGQSDKSKYYLRGESSNE